MVLMSAATGGGFGNNEYQRLRGDLLAVPRLKYDNHNHDVNFLSHERRGLFEVNSPVGEQRRSRVRRLLVRTLSEGPIANIGNSA